MLGVNGAAEIKRMFFDPASRGYGVGRAILSSIEDVARSEGAVLLQLETGIRHREALELYRRCGYRERGPFGRPDPLSVFMEKQMQPICTIA